MYIQLRGFSRCSRSPRFAPRNDLEMSSQKRACSNHALSHPTTITFQSRMHQREALLSLPRTPSPVSFPRHNSGGRVELQALVPSHHHEVSFVSPRLSLGFHAVAAFSHHRCSSSALARWSSASSSVSGRVPIIGSLVFRKFTWPLVQRVHTERDGRAATNRSA